jgi:hypothetical protein
MKKAVFWDVAPCGVADLMMEAVNSCEVLVSMYVTTYCTIPEDSYLEVCGSHNVMYYFLLGSILP